ncbi:997_t:CDS:2, partial [Funneliformis caledonium]
DQSFEITYKKPASDRLDINFLDRHVMKQCEGSLHYIVDIKSKSRPSVAKK